MGNKKLLFIPLLLAFGFLIYLSPKGVEAETCLDCGDHKIRICHATSSATNPYNNNNVDKNATADGHNGHDNDIIPPYWYWDRELEHFVEYTGKNWDLEGMVIWNNGCEVPLYSVCSSTERIYGEWSDWMDDPADETQEYREREVSAVDVRYPWVICNGPVIQTEYRYKVCSRTVRTFDEWSEWVDDTADETQEYRERNAYAVDSQDSKVICVGPIVQTEYRYKVCSRTVRSFDEWSGWAVDLEDETQECRERNAYAVDSQNSEVVCVGPVVQTECRDVEEQYEPCEYTTEIYGEWSDWAVDPEDETREFRQRIVNTVDSEDSQTLCGEPELEKEYRDIEEDGDVLGTSDEAEVLGISIVYADTAGGSDLLLVQYALMVLTGFSFIFVGKKYLTM